jgi:hypothetical protein
MCLRKDLGKYYYGAYHASVLWKVDGNSITFAPAYPITDKVVRNHFEIAPSTSDKEKCKQYIQSFLSSLFTSEHDQVEKLLPASGGEKVPYPEMARGFYDFFVNRPQRDEFYKNVIANSCGGDVWASFENLLNKLKQHCSEWPSKFCPILISISASSTLIAE